MQIRRATEYDLNEHSDSTSATAKESLLAPNVAASIYNQSARMTIRFLSENPPCRLNPVLIFHTVGPFSTYDKRCDLNISSVDGASLWPGSARSAVCAVE